jgi:nucleotide-binding universal stress UspA family protein
MMPVRTILCPTDFSRVSAAALELAAGLARDSGARLIVLHVAEPPPLVQPGELARALQEPDGYRAELQAQLRRFQPAGLEGRVDYQLREGAPAAEILRAAAEAGCDLIVMGTAGRTGLGRLLLGSVAEQVLRQAACPVLTVTTPGAGVDRGTAGSRTEAEPI